MQIYARSFKENLYIFQAAFKKYEIYGSESTMYVIGKFILAVQTSEVCFGNQVFRVTLVSLSAIPAEKQKHLNGRI